MVHQIAYQEVQLHMQVVVDEVLTQQVEQVELLVQVVGVLVALDEQDEMVQQIQGEVDEVVELHLQEDQEVLES